MYLEAPPSFPVQLIHGSDNAPAIFEDLKHELPQELKGQKLKLNKDVISFHDELIVSFKEMTNFAPILQKKIDLGFSSSELSSHLNRLVGWIFVIKIDTCEITNLASPRCCK